MKKLLDFILAASLVAIILTICSGPVDANRVLRPQAPKGMQLKQYALIKSFSQGYYKILLHSYYSSSYNMYGR
jgi:hypothetical protein